MSREDFEFILKFWPVAAALMGLTQYILYLIFRDRLDDRYAKRSHVDMADGQREALKTLFTQMDDRLGEVEHKYILLERISAEQQRNILEKLSEVAGSTAKTAESVKSIAETQAKHAAMLETYIAQQRNGR